MIKAAFGQELEIRVTEGEGDRHVAGSRAYKGIGIQVTDADGAPVPNARVTFQMPNEGPSGKFANGLARESTTTDPQGRAAAWGISWNGVPGECRIAVFAARGAARAGTTVPILLMAASLKADTASFEVAPPAAAPANKQPPVNAAAAEPEKTPPKPPPPPPPAPSAAVSSSTRFPSREAAAVQRPGVVLSRTERLEESLPSPHRKWIWIGLAAGGAVGGGLLLYNATHHAPAPTTQLTPAALNPTVTRPAIGNPVITIGRP